MREPITEFKVVDGPVATTSPDTIVTLPILTSASDLLLDCTATGGVGVISGPTGSGKSIAMKRLAVRYPSMNQSGNAAYYCCQNASGATKGLIALLGDLGVGGAIIANGNGVPMQLILKIALREFVRKNIQSLLLDETDRWDAVAIAGLFAMHDHLKENGHSVSLLLVTNQDHPSWLAETDSIRSRTLRIIRVGHVSVEEMVGIMAVWGTEFALFAAKVEQGDSDADKIVRHIHASTDGDLRRVNYFARIYLRHFAGKVITMETTEAALERLDQ